VYLRDSLRIIKLWMNKLPALTYLLLLSALPLFSEFAHSKDWMLMKPAELEAYERKSRIRLEKMQKEHQVLLEQVQAGHQRLRAETVKHKDDPKYSALLGYPVELRTVELNTLEEEGSLDKLIPYLQNEKKALDAVFLRVGITQISTPATLGQAPHAKKHAVSANQDTHVKGYRDEPYQATSQTDSPKDSPTATGAIAPSAPAAPANDHWIWGDRQ
jgi:hypothetical protein